MSLSRCVIGCDLLSVKGLAKTVRKTIVPLATVGYEVDQIQGRDNTTVETLVA